MDDPLSRGWSGRLRPRHYLAAAAVLGVGLAAVILERCAGHFWQITELGDRDLKYYACGETRYDGLEGLDVSAPIVVGRFEQQPRSDDEKVYIAEMDRLAAAHGRAGGGARYVLHSSYYPPLSGVGMATAGLCLSGEAKKCRIRNFELHQRLHPALAARIVFNEIVGATMSLSKCRVDPRHSSPATEPDR